MSIRTTVLVLCILAMQLFQFANASSGLFFNIQTSGIPGNASVTLCLNGIGQLSCQNYNVSALHLSITTTIPNHTYDTAGIRINSGGSLANRGITCKSIVNNFCIFSVSNTSPYDINLNNPDYVIIGVGTAGSVLARKLSDDNKTLVVALHNGSNQNQNPLITLAENSVITVLDGVAGAPFYATGTTTAQPEANNRNLNWIYALPFGGASAVNHTGVLKKQGSSARFPLLLYRKSST